MILPIVLGFIAAGLVLVGALIAALGRKVRTVEQDAYFDGRQDELGCWSEMLESSDTGELEISIHQSIFMEQLTRRYGLAYATTFAAEMVAEGADDWLAGLTEIE